MGKNMDKKKQLNVIYLVVALWGIVMFQSFWGHTASQVELSYSEFERYLEQGWLKDLVVDQQTIRGSFKEPIEGKDHFVTPRVDIDLAEKLSPYKVDYKGVISGGPLATLIGWVAPALVFFLVWFLMLYYIFGTPNKGQYEKTGDKNMNHRRLGPPPPNLRG